MASGRIGRQGPNPLNECRLELKTRSFATRKFQYIVRACGESMENEWGKDSSAKEIGFRPLYSMTRKI